MWTAGTTVLCAPTFCDFLRQHVVAWGGDVREADAFRLANALEATSFPFFALLTSEGVGASQVISQGSASAAHSRWLGVLYALLSFRAHKFPFALHFFGCICSGCCSVHGCVGWQAAVVARHVGVTTHGPDGAIAQLFGSIDAHTQHKEEQQSRRSAVATSRSIISQQDQEYEEAVEADRKRREEAKRQEAKRAEVVPRQR